MYHVNDSMSVLTRRRITRSAIFTARSRCPALSFRHDFLVSPTIVFRMTVYILGVGPGVHQSLRSDRQQFIDRKNRFVFLNKMCNKFTVLSLAYLAVFVAVVNCDDGASPVGLVDILSKGNKVVIKFSTKQSHVGISIFLIAN